MEHYFNLLNDYTTDRRGDIGSRIRIEALEGAKVVLGRDPSCAKYNKHYARKIVGCITRLASEKLDKVRFQAWLCLEDFWASQSGFPLLKR